MRLPSLIVLVIIAVTGLSLLPAQATILDDTIGDAYTAIVEAEKAGADITTLVSGFNAALVQPFIEETFLEIREDAETTRLAVLGVAERNTLLLYLSVPMFSGIISVSFYLSVKLWKKLRMKRLLQMEVRKA